MQIPLQDRPHLQRAAGTLEILFHVSCVGNTLSYNLNTHKTSSYYVGVYNKRTKTTTLRPAPLYILSRQVKALKNLKPIEVSTDERIKQRNLLGETFGTKKAKAAIRAQERNRVDIDAMKSVAGHLQETIGENTGSLPTQGALLKTSAVASSV